MIIKFFNNKNYNKERKFFKMKNYVKPIAKIETVLPTENLSNLAGWLEGAGIEYENAGITTYVVVS